MAHMTEDQRRFAKIKIAGPAVRLPKGEAAKIRKAVRKVMKEHPLRDSFDADRSPSVKTFIAQFEAFVRMEYGPPCDKRAAGCRCCEMWAVFDLVNTMIV